MRGVISRAAALLILLGLILAAILCGTRARRGAARTALPHEAAPVQPSAG